MLLSIPKNTVLTIGLVLSFVDGTAIAQAGKSYESKRSYPSINNSLYSFEATGSVELPVSKRKLSKEIWADTICYFLQVYFQGKFKSGAMLINQTPPIEFLQSVKGYVTGEDGYWEQDLINLDHIEINGSTLRFECKIQGVYVRLKTPFISKERLAEGIGLEKDYTPELEKQCLSLVDTLKKYIIKS